MEQKEKVYIAVCDDEEYVHDEIRLLLEKYQKENNVNCILHHFYSAAELLSFSHSFDILLLDIEMPGMDGIEAAFRLENRGTDCKIIMLTCRVDRFKDAFKIGAIRFVTKPVEEGELFEAMDDARMRMAGRGTVRVSRDGRSYSVMQKEIAYVMADGSATKVFTEKCEYRSENTLSGWEEQLNKSIFFLCHRSYLVNLSKIVQIEKKVAVLTTGEKVPVARRKYAELLHAYMEFDLKLR